MTNLAAVSPIPAGSGKVPPDESTASRPGKSAEKELTLPSDRTLYAPSVLTLQLFNGRAMPVASGGVLGRSGDALLFFEDFQTVSRRHAKVDFRDGAWHIEDLQSTNGTWINGNRLEPGQPRLLRAGDVVALSLACEMRVVE
jgi:hypothetical protein